MSSPTMVIVRERTPAPVLKRASADYYDLLYGRTQEDDMTWIRFYPTAQPSVVCDIQFEICFNRYPHYNYVPDKLLDRNQVILPLYADVIQHDHGIRYRRTVDLPVKLVDAYKYQCDLNGRKKNLPHSKRNIDAVKSAFNAIYNACSNAGDAIWEFSDRCLRYFDKFMQEYMDLYGLNSETLRAYLDEIDRRNRKYKEQKAYDEKCKREEEKEEELRRIAIEISEQKAALHKDNPSILTLRDKAHIKEYKFQLTVSDDPSILLCSSNVTDQDLTIKLENIYPFLRHRKRKPNDLHFHSKNGYWYTWDEFIEEVDDLGIAFCKVCRQFDESFFSASTKVEADELNLVFNDRTHNAEELVTHFIHDYVIHTICDWPMEKINKSKSFFKLLRISKFYGGMPYGFDYT